MIREEGREKLSSNGAKCFLQALTKHSATQFPLPGKRRIAKSSGGRCIPSPRKPTQSHLIHTGGSDRHLRIKHIKPKQFFHILRCRGTSDGINCPNMSSNSVTIPVSNRRNRQGNLGRAWEISLVHYESGQPGNPKYRGCLGCGYFHKLHEDHEPRTIKRWRLK